MAVSPTTSGHHGFRRLFRSRELPQFQQQEAGPCCEHPGERFVSGNGAIYGAITANTITDSGNGALHYCDTALAAAPASTGFYTMISYREVSY